MPPTFQIDHIVIMVHDLAQAITDYRTLGFTVLEGGKHPGNPTHNALVVFQDGVYLEIIALIPGDDTPPTPRLQQWLAASPGLVHYALLPNDIEADVAAARSRGLDIEDPQPGGRLRPDGQEVVWKTANLAGAGLPFFCFDVTPRALRVPEEEARQHSNGVTGVADLTIAVTDLQESATQYQALLGLEARPKSVDKSLAAHGMAFSLGDTSITLAQPANPNSVLHSYLASGGQRPFSFTLYIEKSVTSNQLDTQLTHEARILLQST